jgi:hypothetical protein
MGSTSIFKIVGYIVLGGFLIGFYGFREQFMEWFWTGGILIPGLLGAPIVLGGIFYFLMLYLLVQLVVWFYRNILWG